MEYAPNNNPYPQLSPTPREKKDLRKYYFKLSWIVIALVFVFSVINSALLTVCGGLIGGDFSPQAIEKGKDIIRSIPVMKAIYSYGFPIIGDLCALGVGLIVTGTDLRKKFTFKGFTGKEVCKFTALAFGVMTVAALVNQVIISVIEAVIGLFSGGGLSEEIDLSSALIVTEGNPLWLDILIYLYICVAGPVLEELIFRGVLLEGLRKYGNFFGIVMSSVLFGLMHQNAQQCIPAICMGMVMAYMAVKSGSLLPSIFIHILNNSLSAVLMAMIESQDMTAMLSDTSQNIEAAVNAFTAFIPFFIALLANGAFRLVCVIASIVIAVQFAGSKKSLVELGDYSRKRTWGYIFTSVPWIVVILYMLIATVTSII